MQACTHTHTHTHTRRKKEREKRERGEGERTKQEKNKNTIMRVIELVSARGFYLSVELFIYNFQHVK
jgi:hypothetical protein